MKFHQKPKFIGMSMYSQREPAKITKIGVVMEILTLAYVCLILKMVNSRKKQKDGHADLAQLICVKSVFRSLITLRRIELTG